MARKVVTTCTDDLTGEMSENISAHTILINGAGVQIDLTDDNYEALLAILTPYLHAEGARRIRGITISRKNSRTRKRVESDDAPSKVRSWARANGFNISDRGRMPSSVHKAYKEAHSLTA
ncbi:histone-like nucleoid-structuring protein Lsr2 [Streptomyces sp. NPDC055085]